MSPELRAPHLERNAGARARLLEHDRDGLAGQKPGAPPLRLALHARREREDFARLRQRQVGELEKIALGRHVSSNGSAKTRSREHPERTVPFRPSRMRPRALAQPRDLRVHRARSRPAEALLGRDRRRGFERSQRFCVERSVDLAGTRRVDARERHPFADGERDERPDGLVRLAKGDAAPDERLGQVRRLREPLVEGSLAALPVELDVLDGQRDDSRAPPRQRPRLEQRQSVLLLVAVVPARQPLHERQQRDHVAHGPRALAADQLEDVGVLLLRHHARAGGDRAVEPHEGELAGREVDHVARQASQREDRARRAPRPVEREVAVADRVERVARRLPGGEQARHERPVDRKRRPRARAAAERHLDLLEARSQITSIARASPTPHAATRNAALTGCARWRCVYAGSSTSFSRAARSASAATSAASSPTSATPWSRTCSRRSSAT